jgi:hypothetical protein
MITKSNKIRQTQNECSWHWVMGGWGWSDGPVWRGVVWCGVAFGLDGVMRWLGVMCDVMWWSPLASSPPSATVASPYLPACRATRPSSWPDYITLHYNTTSFHFISHYITLHHITSHCLHMLGIEWLKWSEVKMLKRCVGPLKRSPSCKAYVYSYAQVQGHTIPYHAIPSQVMSQEWKCDMMW